MDNNQRKVEDRYIQASDENLFVSTLFANEIKLVLYQKDEKEKITKYQAEINKDIQNQKPLFTFLGFQIDEIFNIYFIDKCQQYTFEIDKKAKKIKLTYQYKIKQKPKIGEIFINFRKAQQKQEQIVEKEFLKIQKKEGKNYQRKQNFYYQIDQKGIFSAISYYESIKFTYLTKDSQNIFHKYIGQLSNKKFKHQNANQALAFENISKVFKQYFINKEQKFSFNTIKKQVLLQYTITIKNVSTKYYLKIGLQKIDGDETTQNQVKLMKEYYEFEKKQSQRKMQKMQSLLLKLAQSKSLLVDKSDLDEIELSAGGIVAKLKQGQKQWSQLCFKFDKNSTEGFQKFMKLEKIQIQNSHGPNVFDNYPFRFKVGLKQQAKIKSLEQVSKLDSQRRAYIKLKFLQSGRSIIFYNDEHLECDGNKIPTQMKSKPYQNQNPAWFAIQRQKIDNKYVLTFMVQYIIPKLQNEQLNHIDISDQQFQICVGLRKLSELARIRAYLIVSPPKGEKEQLDYDFI